MGIGDLTLLNTNLTDSAVTMGATTLSFALFFGIFSGAAILYTNKKYDFRSWDNDEIGVAGGLLGVMVGVETIPGLNSFVTSNSLIGLAGVILLSVGIWWLAYKR
ncbi:hypothetical protein B4589_009845 [Halolamina sp. CBA1230]|uniref:hypothetical protein n=1 Tax=Halolamina sp. CBA1230 TaxID=1853690 RepID=UPI0009A1BDBC|nr:hypothetical protein [Halolamina sp. CBA1230]QKY20666.1 hypothetical protein B4589_009845 [Halolamina sp. CBA1230]